MAISKRTLSILWFGVSALALCGAGAVLFQFSDRLRNIPNRWESISPSNWAIVALGSAAFYGIDYFRLFALLRVIGERLGVLQGLKVNAASSFAASLTPTAELHVPVAVFFLAKAGIPVSKATATIASKTMYTIIWISILSFLSFMFHPSLQQVFAKHPVYYSLPLIGIATIFISIIVFSQSIHRWARVKISSPHLQGWRRSFVRWLDQSAGTMSMIGRSGDRMHMAAHAATVGYILSYAFVGYWLCRSVGIDLGWTKAIAVFSTSLLVAYLAPVPGSIGVTEVATAYLIDQQVTGESLAAAMLLRLLCNYLIWIPGAAIVFNSLRKEGLKLLQS